MSNGFNGWNMPMLVTLTATSNKFLADRLPLRGWLEVLEMGADGYAMAKKFSFLEVNEEGEVVGAKVAADHAEFSYSQPVPSEAARERGIEILGKARDEVSEAWSDLSRLREGIGDGEQLSPELKEQLRVAENRHEAAGDAWWTEQDNFKARFGTDVPRF